MSSKFRHKWDVIHIWESFVYKVIKTMSVRRNHKGRWGHGTKYRIVWLNSVWSWNSALFSLHVGTHSFDSFQPLLLPPPPLPDPTPFAWTHLLRGTHGLGTRSHSWDPWPYGCPGSLHVWPCLGKSKTTPGKTSCSSISKTYYTFFFLEGWSYTENYNVTELSHVFSSL